LRRILLIAVAVCLALPTFLTAAASVQVDRGIAYIRTTQQPDGGFGGFGDGQSFDAVFAIRSAGIDPSTVKKDGKSPADFLINRANAQTTPGAAAKAAMAAVAMNMDPRNVSGVNLVARITAGAGEAGKYGNDDFTQSIAIIALRVAGEGIPAGASSTLLASQGSDGGWGFGGFSDPDTTAIALQALVALNDTAPANAVKYLKAQQLPDGGWGFGDSNANSTAFVVQALLAAGIDPNGAEFNKSGKTPLGFLNSQQQPDGSFLGFDPSFATNQAVPALAGRTFLNAPTTPLPAAAPTTPVPPIAVPTPIQPAATITVAAPTATQAIATATSAAPTARPTSASTAAPPAPATIAPPAAPPSSVPAPPATGSGSQTPADPGGPIVLAGLVCVVIAGVALGFARRRSE
jgi:hypothetical protein